MKRWHTSALTHGEELHAELVKAVGSKDLVDALARQGLEAVSSTPEEYAARLKADAPKWAAAVKASGAKVQSPQ